MLFIWRHDTSSWRGDVIKWHHLQNLLKLCINHQISGRIHATEMILVSFCTFSRTGIRKLLNFCSMFGGWPLNSRSPAILRDLYYLRLYSSYQKDLSVYFHLIEVDDHYNGIINTATVKIYLQIQGHALFCVTFHISDCTRATGEISVSISTLSRSPITIMI